MSFSILQMESNNILLQFTVVPQLQITCRNDYVYASTMTISKGKEEVGYIFANLN